MDRFFYLIYFFFGAIFGSFIYASVYRQYHNLPIAKGRSSCPNCNHELSAFDLVPLLSFIFLKGRCRYCKAKISWEYFVFEFISGILIMLTGITVQNTLNVNMLFDLSQANRIFLFKVFFIYLYSFFISSIFFYFALHDFKYRIIANKVIIPLIIFFTSFFLIIGAIGFYYNDSIYKNLSINHLLSAVGAGCFFFLIIILTRGKGMGGGDMKLAIFIGLILGYPKVLFVLYLAFALGAIIGVGLIILKKKNMRQSIPFGPFLAFASVAFFLYGDILFNDLLLGFVL